MTTFLWWTVIYFADLAVSRALSIWSYGGQGEFRRQYSDGVLAVADLMGMIVWLVLWFYVVKKQT